MEKLIKFLLIKNLYFAFTPEIEGLVVHLYQDQGAGVLRGGERHGAARHLAYLDPDTIVALQIVPEGM